MEERRRDCAGTWGPQGSGPVTKKTNRLGLEIERKSAVVLEKYNTLGGRLACECLGGVCAYGFKTELAVWLFLRRVKVTQANERGVLADKSFVQSSLICQALLEGLGQVGLQIGTAVNIGTSIQ